MPRQGLRTGIVHLGVGAFARAHTAVYTEDAMSAGDDLRWGIAGVTQRSSTVADQLAAQDGLFTVSERGTGAAPVRVISSITEAISGVDNPQTVVDRISARTMKLVTLTITEKGYRMRPGGRSLDLTDPLIRGDLGGALPRTAVGQIVRGLQQRSRSDAGPITVVSCDNLPGNGELTQNLILGFVDALPAAESVPLARWITANTAFPSTMVDRMVPSTSAADLDAVERELGLRDEGAVTAEPFRQWVIEDAFASDRPRWEDAGATLTGDVAAWESAKLRLLNASHSMLAYLGLNAGMGTISDVVANPAFLSACRRMMAEEAIPTITLPADLHAETYCADILSRFANPALGHTTAKVGSDGSQKIGLRLLPTVRRTLEAGRKPRWSSLAVAAWMHHVASTPSDKLDDPLATELSALMPSSRAASAVVPALLSCRSVFDPWLAANQTFASTLSHWYGILQANSADGISKELAHA